METMNKNLFHGELVRLTLEDADRVAAAFSRWGQDMEYARLLDSGPVRLFSSSIMRQWIEKEYLGDNPGMVNFFIRTLADDRLIGFIGLGGIHWNHGDAFVGIGIGEREYWGKGYGTDAMRVLLRFAFEELNLHRVSLTVFEYNPRAIRSYEKAGFAVEGRVREFVHRGGRRWDMICMGILRREWEQMQRVSAVTQQEAA
ncbi:MAG: GNAT family N-acetyltransferase [Chloroflexi bacterium]|jgi:RimJ/RimL family protein N-acetyltransferase|nr:GNAT family N-acetyltransferase [Chloroflexota bacterium]